LDLDAFRRDGALHLPGLFADGGIAALAELASEGPGKRLRGRALSPLIEPATAAAKALIGDAAKPVRAVLFDKTPDANWAVAWHQDRTIVVRERLEMEGFGPWSRKDRLLHVAPPIEVLNGMATLRIHLDPCRADNSPLMVAVGSHRLGRVPAREVAGRAGQHAQLECLAEAGDVWAYSTPILHTSARARRPSRRRVLQVDYSVGDLPGGLAWAGVDG
jgi:ectoine hydroxylase-related dioxygenase (phytanoyl-CoA dioxygenase family)